jgi:hypothetical protein
VIAPVPIMPAETGPLRYGVPVSGRVPIAACLICATVGGCVARSPWFNEYYLCGDLAQASICDGEGCVTVMCGPEYHLGCEADGFAFARVGPDVLPRFAEKCLAAPRTQWEELWADECSSAPDDAGASGAEGEADSGRVDSGGAPAYGVRVDWDVQVGCLERIAL